jgi:hypothetical protein
MSEIEQEIMDKKEMIIENQVEINKFAKKLEQRDECITEIKLVLKNNFKDLEKEIKRSKTETKSRTNSSLVPSDLRATLDSDTSANDTNTGLHNYYGMREIQTEDNPELQTSPTKYGQAIGDRRVSRELISKLITQHNRENTDSVNCGS